MYAAWVGKLVNQSYFYVTFQYGGIILVYSFVWEAYTDAHKSSDMPAGHSIVIVGDPHGGSAGEPVETWYDTWVSDAST